MGDPRADAVDTYLDDQQLTPADAPWGAWHGTGDAFKGLLRTAAGAGRTVFMAGAPIAMGVDKAHDLADTAGQALSNLGAKLRSRGAMSSDTSQQESRDHTEAQDTYFREVVDDLGSDAVDAWTPDATQMGAAARVLHAGSNLAGSVPFVVGAPELFLANTMFDPATDLVRDGVDSNTALAVGGINLAANAVGLKAPAAVGSSLAGRVASGAAINTGTGIASEAASAGVLDARGYDEQAKQHDPLDATNLFMSAGLGALFGAHAHLEAPASLPTRDAAMTARNAGSFRAAAQATAPRTLADVQHGEQALSSALEQLNRGEQVDVSKVIGAQDWRLPEASRVGVPGDALPPMGLTQDATVKPRGKPTAEVTAAIDAAAAKHGVPRFLLYALAEQESGFNPRAHNGEFGAAGVMQYIPESAKAHGIDAYDVNASIDAAAKDAAARMKAGGIDEAIASHFAGPGGGNRGPKTREYVREVKARAARWAKALGDDASGMRETFASPDTVSEDAFVKRLTDRGIDEATARDVAPVSARDAVTGFYEGRIDTFKSGELDRVQQHVEATGERAHFVSADIANLGGLNAHFNDVAGDANVHYRKVAEIVRDELAATGADVVPMRTGGDEFGFNVINAPREVVAQAVESAQAKVAKYVRKQGLDAIPHPKGGAPGLSVHLGHAEITPRRSADAIFADADAGVHRSKQKGKAHVRGSAPEAARPVASEGRPGRAAAGQREAAGGRTGGSRPVLDGARGEGSGAGTPGAVALETPVDAAARQAEDTPDALVNVAADGEAPRYVPFADALDLIEADRALAANDADAVTAAANCALRRGYAS